MSIKTSNENICINRIILQKEENFMVEGDEIVPDIKPDVLNIISTNGTVCVYKKELQDGKIKIDGTLNVYTLYIADDETASIRCISSCLDFSKTIEAAGIKSDMQLEQAITGKYNDWHPVWHTIIFFTIPIKIFKVPVAIIGMQVL